MKKIILQVLAFTAFWLSFNANAQTTHVIALDSANFSDFTWPNDTTLSITNGDSVVIINELASMDFYIWLNDTTMTTGPQPTTTINTNAPIFYFTVVNDSTWSSPLGTLYNIEYFTLHAQTETFGGRFFFNYNSVGIKENSVNVRFKIFPNPSKGKFQVAISDVNADELKELKFEVVDFFGKIIYQHSNVKFIAGYYEIDLTEMPSGIYLFKIYHDNLNVQTLKIVKE